KIEAAPLVLDSGKQLVDRSEILDIARQAQIRLYGFGQGPHALAECLALIGQREPRALIGQFFCDTPSDRMIVGNADDDPAPSLHPTHGTIVPFLRSAAEGGENKLTHRAA